MKSTFPLKNLALLIIFSFSFGQVVAQFPRVGGNLGKKLGKSLEKTIMKKAEDKAEEVLTRKLEALVEKKMDELLDKILTGEKSSSPEDSVRDEEALAKEGYDKEKTNALLERMFGASDIELEKSYGFEAQVDIEMYVEGSKDKADKAAYSYYFMKDKSALGVKPHEVEETDFVVIQDGKFITFMNSDGNKMAMAIDISKLPNTVETLNDEEYKASFSKSGRSKEILGFYCEEYTFESKTSKGNAWIAAKFPFSYENITTAMRNPQIQPYSLKGFALETTSYQKDKPGEKVFTKVTHYDPKVSYDFDASSYQVVGISQFLQEN